MVLRRLVPLLVLLAPAAAAGQAPLVLRATLPVAQPADRLFAFDAEGDGDLDLWSGPAGGPGSIELRLVSAGVVGAAVTLTPLHVTFAVWTPCLANADALADVCYADTLTSDLHYQIQLAGPTLNAISVNGFTQDGQSARDLRAADVSAALDGQVAILNGGGDSWVADPSGASISLFVQVITAVSATLRVVDVDGDGVPEILGLGPAALSVARNAGLPLSWNAPTSIPLGGGIDAVAGELDGLPGGDLAVVDGAGVVTLVSDALGAATTIPLATLGPATALAALDLDGDGDLDLAVALAGPAVALLRADGAGGFVDAGSLALPAPSPISALAVADVLDADGVAELIVAQGADGLAVLGPYVDLAPVIDAAIVSPDPVPEGSSFTIDVTARAPEVGQPLTYELLDPGNVSLDVVGPTANTNATLVSPPVERLCEAPGTILLRTYTVRVDDAGFPPVDRSVVVRIEETVDERPTVTVPVGPTTLLEGIAATFTVTASDDCGAPTVTWRAAPEGLTLLSAGLSVEVTAPDACGDAIFELFADVVDGSLQAGTPQRLELLVDDLNAPVPSLQPPAELTFVEDLAAEWAVPLDAPCGVVGLSCTADLSGIGALPCRVEPSRLVVSVDAIALCADLAESLVVELAGPAGLRTSASISVTAEGSADLARFAVAADAPLAAALPDSTFELRAPAVVDDACEPPPVYLFAEAAGAGRATIVQDGGPIAIVHNVLQAGAAPSVGCRPSAMLHVTVDGSAPSATLELPLPIVDTTPPVLVPPASPLTPAKKGAPVTLTASATDDCGAATLEATLSDPARATLRRFGDAFEIEPLDCRADGAVTLTLQARDGAGHTSAAVDVPVRLATAPASPIVPPPVEHVLDGAPLALPLDVVPGCGRKVCVSSRSPGAPALLDPDGHPAPRCADGRLTLRLEPAEQARYFPPAHRLAWDVQDEAGGAVQRLEVVLLPAGDLATLHASIATPDARPGEVVALDVTLASRLPSAVDAQFVLRLDAVGLRVLTEGVVGATPAADERAFSLSRLPAAPDRARVRLWAVRTEEPGPPGLRARLYTSDGRPISAAAEAAPHPPPILPGLSCAASSGGPLPLAALLAVMAALRRRRRP